VVIARALLNKPALIIADEPTGNLDPESSAMVMKIFWRTVKNGSSVFMATHNYNLIEKNNSRILKCENSTVIELTEKQDFLIS
jgi:cell division transport system ATP-binding protein